MSQKKGLIYRLTMGKDNQPDFTTDKLPGSRWAVFKDVFKLRLGALVKVNILTLLFFLPAIVWLVLVFVFFKPFIYSMLPYSANLGIGYPAASDAILAGNYSIMTNAVVWDAVLIPLLMIGFLGLAGALQVLKLLAWGEGIHVVPNFFKGIKNNWASCLFAGFFTGAAIFLLDFVFNSYSIIPSKWYTIVGIVVSIIALILVAFMVMFMLTQGVTYKLKMFPLVKNSFLLSIALFPQNLFFMLISLLPYLLMILFPGIFLQGMFATIFVMLIAFVGFSYTLLIWTLYSHYVFDKFINDKVEGAMKDKGIYRKSEERKKEEEERRRKAANVRFTNPKKKKPIKSIEEGKTFTPLTSGFSRADLARLAEEKEEVKKEIDEEIEELNIPEEELDAAVTDELDGDGEDTDMDSLSDDEKALL